MVIEKEFLSLKDAAEVCGVKPNTFSNWRDRDPKFPLPYMEVGSGPLWKAEDIIAYMNNKYKEDMCDIVAINNLASKRMALIGRARVGKSFIISRFVENKKEYVGLLCSKGKDKTACPINVRISEQVAVESFVFHSNFNSIYSGKDKEDEVLSDLNSRLGEIINQPHQMDDTAGMEAIESIIKEIRGFEEKYDTLRNSDTYIDIYQKPSNYAKKLLRECKLGSIEIVDTPGVSGKVEASKIAKSDIYAFVLKDDNAEEANTLLKIVEAIKADVGTSKVLYIYKADGILSSKEEYDEAREEVREAISSFTSIFDELRGSIIATDLALLNPEEHCIAFPQMNKDKPSFPEDEFMQELTKAMSEAFKENDSEEQDKKFVELVNACGEKAKKLVKDILDNIPEHGIGNKGTFTLDEFTAEDHDRVMTGDNCRLRIDLSEAYGLESKLLHEYFSEFKVDAYPEEWQQFVIKYIYNKLANSTRSDRGLGKGGHPREEIPARTMLVEESVLADQILDSIKEVAPFSRNIPYRKVFIDNNISSVTWKFVGCVDDKESELKLRLVRECLLSRNVSTRREMVLCRYVGGLRFVAMYSILSLLGESDEEIIGTLKKAKF